MAKVNLNSMHRLNVLLVFVFKYWIIFQKCSTQPANIIRISYCHHSILIWNVIEDVYTQPNFLNKYWNTNEMNWDENHSTLTCINWIVMADFPTPPPPTTTILYVWVWLDGPDDWLYRDIFNFTFFFTVNYGIPFFLLLTRSPVLILFSFSLSRTQQKKNTNTTRFLLDARIFSPTLTKTLQFKWIQSVILCENSIAYAFDRQK